ncbi:sensor histidine kinase [Domibacillus aminovorans]|uniref:histidine kinase n=1 Tax=Domibacillus aminovorans TaxID=29332 RepID=A0A177L345_9BACI|nr:HAMP domain-containing sensor histidine kinase [Domibacillus aminovorans]OAH60110.1 hypothetical protein AWH49_18065 [Domibacillus aminovorans]
MTTILDNLQTFLLNIFLVYFCFSIYFKFIERKANKLTNELIIALISGISIVLCMTFPITLPAGYIIDFRQIPFIIGALYGGWRVAVFLTVILVSYRFFLDVPSTDAALILYFLLIISLWPIILTFNKTVNIRKKLYLASLASFFGILSWMAMIFLFMPENLTRDYFILFIFSLIVQSIGIIFFVVFNEKSKKEAALNNELDKLEKLKTVSELAASISHEVRNPLTVAKGFLQLLKEPNLTDQDRTHYLNIAVDALNQAESRITDYLTFAKPSLENIKILDLHQELIYIEKFIGPYAAMNNVQIEVQLEEDIYIAGEDQKLHQCLINIMKNGIESMPQGGKLLIELRRVGDNAMITVTDTGIGMDEEQLERMGSPFFTTKDIGTGLGTMVVYSIVKTMRGEITVKSEIGKGTSFSVLLPLAEISLS